MVGKYTDLGDAYLSVTRVRFLGGEVYFLT